MGQPKYFLVKKMSYGSPKVRLQSYRTSIYLKYLDSSKSNKKVTDIVEPT